MGSGMIHLNKNVLCAIDLRITGDDIEKNEIVQLAIMPLDSHIYPNKSILPFFCDIQPVFPSNFNRKTSNLTETEFNKIRTEGIERWTSVDLFEQWYEQLKIPSGKKIMPLTYNWLVAYPFLEKWLGGAVNLHHFFDVKRYRDLMNTAHFLNDYYDFHIERCPFPKTDFQYICLCNKIPRERPTDSLLDCLYIAENYQLMLRDSMVRMPYINKENREALSISGPTDSDLS